MMSESKHIFPVFKEIISRVEKENLLKQKALVVWLTGLSGSGKTSIAKWLEKALFDKGILSQLLDGDNIRMGISQNLGFSAEDREENIRRIAEVSKLFMDCGIVTINCFVSPMQAMRDLAREIVGNSDFIEVYVDTPLNLCEQRDVKGLYKKARSGEIKNFTGVSAPYEAPENADLVIKTENRSIEDCGEELLNMIIDKISHPS